jgi:HK97 family phage portal protein
MKILGFDINFQREKKDVLTGGYSTQYANAQANILFDGKEIARNFRTYGIMYRINPDIRRCVVEIQQTTGKAGYQLKKQLKTDGKEKEITNDQFELALQRSGGFRQLKNDLVMNLSIFANGFLRKHMNARKQPIKYSVLDSRYVTIFTDSELNVLRYQYQPPVLKGKIETFLPEEIIHVRENRDIDNPLYGISILETLVLDVMGDEEAGQSNYHFFVNDNIPSAVYVLREGMTKEQQEQQMKIIGDGLKGGHNKHKSIVSSAVEDVKPIRQNHNDMAFKEQRKFTTERICAAMGVPRTILGYVEDVNHSNGESQYEKFIENTIRPWERVIEEVFTQLARLYDETLLFTINDEHIDDLEQRSKLAVQNVTNGLWTRNEARDYLGYETLKEELMDEIFVNTNQTPIVFAGEQPTPPGTPTDPNDPNAAIPPEEKPVKVKITHHISHG